MYGTSIKSLLFVQDFNDYAPVFTQNGMYEQWILENTPPGTSVETVLANDLDPDTTPNGRVVYRIVTGSQDKFSLDPDDGEITVAPGATFDYNVQKRYTMRVRLEHYSTTKHLAHM